MSEFKENTIFIGNLSFDTSEFELRNFISNHGETNMCKIIKDKDTGKSRGYGFVEFKQKTDMEKFLQQNVTLRDRKLFINKSNKTENINKKLYITNFPIHMSQNQLEIYFQKFGEVENVKVIKDLNDSSRVFGFVTFKSFETAQDVVKNKIMMNGRELTIEFSKPKNENKSNKRKPYTTESKQDYDQYVMRENLRKIFVAQLNNKINKQMLNEYFSRFGVIENSVIIKKGGGKLQGYGFVTFRAIYSADRAVNTRIHTICGQNVIVKYAEVKNGSENFYNENMAKRTRYPIMERVQNYYDDFNRPVKRIDDYYARIPSRLYDEQIYNEREYPRMRDLDHYNYNEHIIGEYPPEMRYKDRQFVKSVNGKYHEEYDGVTARPNYVDDRSHVYQGNHINPLSNEYNDNYMRRNDSFHENRFRRNNIPYDKRGVIPNMKMNVKKPQMNNYINNERRDTFDYPYRHNSPKYNSEDIYYNERNRYKRY